MFYLGFALKYPENKMVGTDEVRMSRVLITEAE